MQKFNIPFLKQALKSDDCLRCCLYMILKFLGCKITQEEIWDKLKVYKKGSGLYGAYFTDAGVLGIQKGLNATIYHGNWTWWDKYSSQATGKKNLKDALEKLKSSKKASQKKVIGKEINFLENGGNFIFKTPALGTLDYYLEKNIPIMISVSRTQLYGDANGVHVVIVNGKSEKEYSIIDPLEGEKKVDKERLLFAWSWCGGWALILENI